MKRHSMFEEVPSGLRFYASKDFLNTCQGYWVPVPLYWLLCGWRKLYLAYLRWRVRHYTKWLLKRFPK